MALKVYLEEDLAEEAQQVLDAGKVGSAELLASAPILAEFRHALAKRNRRGELSSTETQEIWETFGYYPLSFFEVRPLVPRAAEIAWTGPDAPSTMPSVFVALAEAEGAVVVTAERRLLNALKGIPLLISSDLRAG